MNHSEDWVLAPINEFITFSDKFYSEVLAHAVWWGVNTDDSTEILKEQKTFKDNHVISSVPSQHNSLNIQRNSTIKR